MPKLKARRRLRTRVTKLPLLPLVRQRLSDAMDALIDYDGLIYESMDGGDDGSLSTVIEALNKVLREPEKKPRKSTKAA